MPEAAVLIMYSLVGWDILHLQGLRSYDIDPETAFQGPQAVYDVLI